MTALNIHEDMAMKAKEVIFFVAIFAVLAVLGVEQGFCAGVIKQRQRMQMIQRQRQIMYEMAQLKEAYKQAVQHGNYQLANRIRAYYENMIRQLSSQRYTSQQYTSAPPQSNTHDSSADSNVADISDVIAQLDVSSQIWTQIIDEGPKLAIIDHYKEVYSGQGVVINRPSSDYLEIIDTLLEDNPDMLQYPFKDVLKSAAVSQNDFLTQ